jgi:hypothetical protein
VAVSQDEAQYEARLRACTKSFVVQQVKDKSYDHEVDQIGNSWHEDLNRTMFWMLVLILGPAR